METVNQPAVEHTSVPQGVPIVMRGRVGRASPDLVQELRQAEEDFARGDYIDFTPE